MKPMAQSIEVARAIDRYAGEGDTLAHLEAVGDEVQQVVPDCIGMSLAWTEHGVTFTVEASDEEIAHLDGVQYLDGGPCVTAVDHAIGIGTTESELLSEDSWQLFAQISAARGVRSTLTMPLTEEGQVVGSVNLYARTPTAFDGHHDELAHILGAWAPGAVRNSDLSFSTRRLAEEAPERLRAEGAVAKAVGLLAVRQETDMSVARTRLERAAQRAGVTLAQLATALVTLGNDAAH
jgi:GAF domain-containing protein